MSSLPEEFRQAKILIVDDNATNVILLERILESAGYENVEGETDSRNVRARYEKDHHDLILLDIRMPNMDGHEVMAELAKVDGEGYLPILVLTAQTDQETKLKALSGGAKDFLHKPFDRLEALNRIRNMLEVRLLHKQLKNQNVVLDEMVQERTQQLNDTRMEIIRRLGRAAEFRDNETGMHVIRMSHACAKLASAHGLDDAECEKILNASPMHDVGKIGIPDHILLKPGKLDPDEWEIMKSHAQIGADLLAGHASDLLEMASTIALTHHEKWDGTGYPNGLSGTDIPLGGRITAICDVFDALLSERPYKKAWSVEEAVAEIKAQRGKHFDAELADQFLDILPGILEINSRFRDDASAEIADGYDNYSVDEAVRAVGKL